MPATFCIGLSLLYSEKDYNVLFIISDDLTAEALGTYGNEVCETPNIDRLAAEGTKYTRAYCQHAVCGPSRASFMFGYYPHTREVYGYTSGRKENGDRESWSEFFKNRGYVAARVSKIYHMNVPGTIEKGGNGSDDAQSWTERYNSQGGEAKLTFAAGDLAIGQVAGWSSKAENLHGGNNPNGTFPNANKITGGNKYEYVISVDEDSLNPAENAQSDAKTAKTACNLIEKYKGERFFLAVGFVRPHIPFVAPKEYFEKYPWQDIVLPHVPEGDQDDIRRKHKTTQGFKFNDDEKKKAIAGYYASTDYMDEQVGKVLDKLEEEGLEDETVVIFTSDHGYFIGEHDFWSKQYVLEESARVPLIIKVPGKEPAVCDSIFELIDLFPTTAELCGFSVPERLQGVSQVATFDDPKASLKDEAFTVFKSNSDFALRTAKYTFVQYKRDGSGGYELYDMINDPHQHTNLLDLHNTAADIILPNGDHLPTVYEQLKQRMQSKIKAAEVFEG